VGARAGLDALEKADCLTQPRIKTRFLSRLIPNLAIVSTVLS